MIGIRLKNISKRFPIQEANPTTFGRLSDLIKFKKTKYFYALKDISLEIEPGDHIGLIGLNGSGKTTLLRIIAGLYEKTSGQVEIEGKITTLLQTDDALEGELSGLENIYLLAHILGINQKNIDSKVKKIVKFAHLEDRIRLPLKELSSGSIQKIILSSLKFVDSDILLFDEVIESSDFNFKNDFINLINKDFKKKIIILSSHDLNLIEQICTKVVVLDKGKIIKFGKTEDTIRYYLKNETV
jgi:teichoic acid transport system ATP-binding protein